LNLLAQFFYPQMNADKRRWDWRKLVSAGTVCAVAGIAEVLIGLGQRHVIAAEKDGQKDVAASRAAFLQVYKVLMHPRCMNCHPNGDQPLQGEDSHVHMMNVKRGEEGMGRYALKCANCHQEKNLAGAHMPPGNPNWHLPPANMRMVFQGRSPRELALQIVDPKRNGGKSMEELLHHADDGLVMWGWDPGDGRSKPPLSHEEFSKQWRLWIENGAVAPE
jgi:hypothetical protein